MLNKNVFPSFATDHYPQVVRWTRASGTTGGKGEVPSLAKEGWPRHQVNGPVPLEARTGWFVQLPIIGGLNQPPHLRPLRRLRDIFLMGAATPLSKEGTSAFPSVVFKCPRVPQKMWDITSLCQGGEFRSPDAIKCVYFPGRRRCCRAIVSKEK